MKISTYTLRRLGVFLLILLCVVACGPKAIGNPCEDPHVKVAPRAPTSTIATSIWVDGTPSMAGFVNVGNSRYIQLLKSLTTVAAEWKGSNSTSYYRFGIEKEKEISNPDLFGIPPKDFERATLPEFYLGGKFSNGTSLPYFENSRVEDAIALFQKNQKPSNQLRIIVTDLGEKEQIVYSIAEKLGNTYLKQDLAVGIFAIRSEFHGKVHDVGPNNEEFDWNTTWSPQTRKPRSPKEYRPFYLVILGTYGNIVHAYEHLQSTQSDLLKEQAQFIVFSPQLVSSSVSLNLDNNLPTFPPEQEKIATKKAINDGKVWIQLSEEESQQIQRFKIDGSGEYRAIYHNIPIDFLPYTLGTNTALDFDQSLAAKFLSDGANSERSQGLKLENIKSENIKSEKTSEERLALSFDAVVDSIKLSTGVHQFTIGLVPEKFNVSDLRSSWSEWNTDDPTEENGAKTYNLFRLMEALATNSITESKGSPIGHFCFIVWKR